jgi:VanZ family protein
VRGRLLAAAACFAIVIVVGSPFAGKLRAAIASAFPGRARAIIGGGVAVAIAAALLTAVARVRRTRGGPSDGDSLRERGALRYFALGAALVAGTLFARALSSGDPDIDVVEAFHFVEYGILTLLFYLAWRPFDDVSVLVLPLLAGLLVGTLDEWFQWFIPFRVGELRDVLLDGAAVGCGLLFSIGVDPPGRFTLVMRRGSAMRIGAMAVVLVLVFALFFQTAFLGLDVRDPRIGVFRSRYTAAELEGAARDRSARWRGAPPPAAGRVSREDQYLTEALWHVRRRNDSVAAGDVFASWRENRILETFYAPVLAPTRSVDRPGFGWPGAQRADTERRAQDDGRPYQSEAEPYRIYVWPKSTFWAAIALVIAVTIVLSVAADRWSRRLS